MSVSFFFELTFQFHLVILLYKVLAENLVFTRHISWRVFVILKCILKQLKRVVILLSLKQMCDIFV